MWSCSSETQRGTEHPAEAPRGGGGGREGGREGAWLHNDKQAIREGELERGKEVRPANGGSQHR